MTRNGSYQALLIDLDGTVVDYARTESAALSAVYRIFFRKHVEFPAFSVVFQAVNDELWEAYRRGETDLDTLRTQRFARLIDRLGPTGPTGEAGSAIVSRFEHELGRRVELFADSLAALRVLRNRATLVLVTDGIAAVQHAKLARTRLRELFEHVVISSEVGFRKPDPRLLRHALARARVARQHALVVGDSLASDGAGAAAAGVDFCWVNRAGVPPGQAPAGPGAAGTARSARAPRATERFEVPDLAALARRLGPGAVPAQAAGHGWQPVVQPE